ncbi:MAG TPA: limonene-1,2-epoxide hydrolase family protein [Alphaproteobacteria bacterium]|jgi:limonene-1,2-epoxide hydrolase|nr:limonene-1,2-epoxide hydrolase family protein [Alphaproteobacteria bacterium]
MLNWISSRRAVLARGALLPVVGLTAAAQPAEAALRSNNVELILAFCKAGQDRDVEKQMTFIDEDSTYHNMPDAEPVVGRAAIRALLNSYVTTTEASEIKVLAIAETSSGRVLNERVDRFRVKGGKWIDCPVMNAAEIENGKIKKWRDYYDAAFVTKQMS